MSDATQDLEQAIDSLLKRIRTLEAENERLRAGRWEPVDSDVPIWVGPDRIETRTNGGIMIEDRDGDCTIAFLPDNMRLCRKEASNE